MNWLAQEEYNPISVPYIIIIIIIVAVVLIFHLFQTYNLFNFKYMPKILSFQIRHLK